MVNLFQKKDNEYIPSGMTGGWNSGSQNPGGQSGVSGGVETPPNMGGGDKSSTNNTKSGGGVAPVNTGGVASINTGGAVNTGGTGSPDYVSQFADAKAKQVEAQRETYVPDKENKGRGVANFFKNALGDPATTEGRRRNVQMISALGDVGRHLANMLYVNNRATPQTIQSTVAMNDARWKQEDALAAQQAKAQQEMALKIAQQQADAGYKEWQMRNGDRTFGLAKDKNDRENTKLPFELEKMASEIVRLEAEGKKSEAEAMKAQVDANMAPALAQALIRQRNASAAASYASAEHQRASASKVREEIKHLGDGKSFHLPVAGNEKEFFEVSNSDKSAVYNALRQYAHQKGWATDKEVATGEYDMKTGKAITRVTKASQNDVIAACMEHYDDPEVQRVFNQYGRRTNSNIDYKL